VSLKPEQINEVVVAVLLDQYPTPPAAVAGGGHGGQPPGSPCVFT